MRLKSISANNIPPIWNFEASDLQDIVVLAGPNGVGKTRLTKAMLSAFQSSGAPNVRLIVEATCPREGADWGKPTLDTRNGPDARLLSATLQRSRKRVNWESSVIQFESDRSIQQLQPYNFSWDSTDPFEEGIGWNYGFNDLKQRFQDTVHSLFRRVRSKREQIASKAETLQKNGERSMVLDFPDPIKDFKAAFSQLLSPKELLDADPRDQNLKYRFEGNDFPITSLSSGEREVVNIVFDFLLRNPSDCIVFFDEPELHLHPELSYKLFQTLRAVGARNQFIFCTHSAELITSSLDNSVIFVSPPKDNKQNQAIKVNYEDESNEALRLLGQSVGIVALGKRIVLIEGTQSSLDKQTYGAIIRDRFPGLVLVPSGGKGDIRNFSHTLAKVLDRAIWGIHFFMLCDRDSLPTERSILDTESNSSGRLRVLKRYHLENYFLDENVLAESFRQMEPETSWLRNPIEIRKSLEEIARKQISYASALIVSARFRSQVGNLDIMPSACDGKTPDQLRSLLLDEADTERRRILLATQPKIIEDATIEVTGRLESSFDAKSPTWQSDIPGRPVLHQFARKAAIDPSRLKHMYIRAALDTRHPVFEDIFQILESFSKA
jgi:energy-coupling factor transporter ATP-binding protein EcfA2